MDTQAPAGGENYVTPDAGLGTEKLPGSFNTRLGDVEGLTKTILTVVVISIGAMIVSMVIGAAALIMDQMHFNNELYRDDQYVHTKTVQQVIHENPSYDNPLRNLQ